MSLLQKIAVEMSKNIIKMIKFYKMNYQIKIKRNKNIRQK